MLQNLLISIAAVLILSYQTLPTKVIAAPSVDAEDEKQIIANDEGYGKDDAEYYSSESDDEAPIENTEIIIDEDNLEEQAPIESNEEMSIDDDVPVDGDSK